MIKLSDDYYIDADTNCYMLKVYNGKDRDNNDIYTTLGYYATIEQTLKALVQDKTRKYIKSSDMKSITDLQSKILEFNKEVKRLQLDI